MDTQLIRRPEVQRRTGLPTSTLYRLVKEGTFPSPVKIGSRSVAWRAVDVETWMAARPTARGEAA